MLKALIKKNVYGFIAALVTNKSRRKKKSNKAESSKGSFTGFIILWAVVILSVAMAFMGTGALMSDTLLPIGLDWMYFVMMGIMGFVLSIIGNSFTASSTLFKAKDNELLLSMPIPMSYILISRMVLLFLLCIVYTLTAAVPTLIQYFIWTESFSIKIVICSLVLVLASSLLQLAISTFLGWIITIISNRVKNKSLGTVVFTITFLGVYYYFYFNANKYLAAIAANSVGLSDSVEKSILGWPVYQYGLGCLGSVTSTLICFAICAAVMAIAFFLVAKNMNSLMTKTARTADNKYDVKEQKAQEEIELQSPKKALLKKEFKHLLQSPVYMINCGFGLLITVAGAVFLLIKMNYMNELVGTMQLMFTDLGDVKEYIPLVLLLGLCAINGSNAFTAPSISLEGKSLWILKIMPVNSKDIYYAKTTMEFYLSAVPTIIFIAASSFVFKVNYSDILYTFICSLLFIQLHAAIGAYLGTKYVKLDWTSEAIPVKQSLGVMLSFFSGAVFSIVVGALYIFILRNYVSVSDYMLGLVIAMALGVRVIMPKIVDKSIELYNNL